MCLGFTQDHEYPGQLMFSIAGIVGRKNHCMFM